MLEISIAPAVSTERSQCPEVIAITKFYVRILGACEDDRACILFATEYSGQTVVETQGESDDATMEGTVEFEDTIDNKDDLV